MSHAILSPSSASRWLNCPPSARLEEQFSDTASEAAAEGTLAHEFCEKWLRFHACEFGKRKLNSELAKLREHKLYALDMEDYVAVYVDRVMELFETAKNVTPDAVLAVEQKLVLTDYIPDGFGTGDAIIIADGTLNICDFKYGKGVRVDANENKQMMLYALGALRDFAMLYEINRVKMTIIQPRLDNISEFEMSVEDLGQWADEVLRPTAQLAFNGEGEFKVGDHCRFCKAKALCRANADANLKTAQDDFRKPPLLTDDEVTEILPKLDALKKWASDIEAYALEAALAGKHFDGFKLVEGRSNRIYSDADKVAITLTGAGIPEAVIYNRQLLGITAMEKALGKSQFEALLSNLVTKPQGKATLVPITDKRPELNSAESAQSDFSNL